MKAISEFLNFQGLLNPKAMARLAVGEALTNLVWAKVSISCQNFAFSRRSFQFSVGHFCNLRRKEPLLNIMKV